jgi:hypothetical protein
MTALKKSDNVLAFFDSQILNNPNEALCSVKQIIQWTGYSRGKIASDMGRAGFRPLRTKYGRSIRYRVKDVLSVFRPW